MYPLNNAHVPDDCAYCTVHRNGTAVTDLDQRSFAYFLSDPHCQSFKLTV